ncbi:porin [Hasllibacter sp. MH4015]|uniref:porin n=1 Tax=Hasllibacter sp. MH4015 TaxID=2854029 RepID=UPI001CD681D7|nr:porin [Hasllibacter sp. MH4015]
MMKPALLAGALVALPTLVSAQGVEFDGAVTLGYAFNSSSIGGTDLNLNGYSIDFDGDLSFSEEFSVGLGFGFSSGDLEIGGLGTDLNIDLISLEVEPQYSFSNGAYVGAYYHMNDLDLALLAPITFGIDANSYGVFGGYDFGQGHVEAFYGTTDLGDSPLLAGLNLDVVDYGVSGAYQVMPELEIYGAVLRTDISVATVDLHATAYSIGASYDLGNGFDIYGAVGGATLDLGALSPQDITSTGLTLGASYDLSQSGSMPIVLSAEYSRTSLDLGPIAGVDPDIDRFAVGLTIPIGNGSSAPLNSNTRTAHGDYRSALGAVLNSF